VRDPADPGRLPKRSNRLIFLFANGNGSGGSDGSGSGRGISGDDDDDDYDDDDDDDGSEGEGRCGSLGSSLGRVLPLTYTESLMHAEARRRSNAEGPSDAAARRAIAAATHDRRPSA